MNNVFPIQFAFIFWAIFLPTMGMCQYVPADTAKTISPSIENPQNQEDESTGFDSKRLVPGGNFAFNFGNPSFVDVSPSIGYLFTDQLLGGIGATYTYLKSNGFSFSFYGGRVFGRHKLFDNVFANAEMDFLNVPDNLLGNGRDGERRWLVSPLIGAGYVIPFGSRGGLQATLLYNLNYQQLYSPYSSGLIWRIGFFL